MVVRLAEHAGHDNVLDQRSPLLVVMVLIARKTGWIISTIGNQWRRLQVNKARNYQSGCGPEETGGVHTNC